MAATDPNRICTCGFRKFRERRTPVTQSVQRWMLFDSAVSGGFGATPFGTFFGAGIDGEWGLFDGVFKETVLETVCESCSRVRTRKDLGGITPIATYVENGFLYVIAADAALATCFSLRFTGPNGEVFESVLTLLPGVTPPPALAPAPPTTAPTPPEGADLADLLLRARLPEVEQPGQYTVELIDSCSGLTTTLVTITLEAPPMILSPLDADLGGAPSLWIHGQAGLRPAAMPASGNRLSIPFDKCTVVHEYDARLGSLPSSQGWSHAGAGAPGDYALVDGGVLQGVTVATSYWERTTTYSVAPDRAYSYWRVQPTSYPAHAAPGDGAAVLGSYATVVTQPYHGLCYSIADGTFYMNAIDLSAGDDILGRPQPGGWIGMGAFDDSVNNEDQAWFEDGGHRIAPPIFGTVGTAGALDATSQFGDLVGTGSQMLYRNVVVSYGGRFIRPFFTSYTTVTNPKIRLYLTADLNASPTKTARFKIRYGTMTADPYAIPITEQSQTLNFTAANSVYELAFELTGLVANLPFWFSVERVWNHADDLLGSTVHMLSASVRSS